MRQQLITWLTEEIVPKVQKNHDPAGTILKFAHEKNLAPALVEGLGQLFNTARSLAYFEKSANRGGEFPILDVPELVSEYLKTPDGSAKKASVNWDYFTDESASNNDLPSCLAGFGKPRLLEQTAPAPAQMYENREKRATADREQSALIVEFAKQAAFDAKEDLRGIFRDVEVKLRQNPEIKFANIERDALYMFGITAPSVLEKLATFLRGQHVHITRCGNDPGPKRLLRDDTGLLEKISTAIDLNFRIEEAAAIIEEQTKQAAAPAAPPQVADPTVLQSVLNPAQAGPGGGAPTREQRTQNFNRGGGASGSGASANRGASGGSSGKGGGKGDDYFGNINSAMDAVVGPAMKHLGDRAKGVLTGVNNADQRHVDRAHQDAVHTSILQNLLTTDEVLSEADPERVVEIYNTIRQQAPTLAGDINVMRVALRSAVQHDGMSPFDLKNFLDTEQASQKVDFNRRILDAVQYKGAPMQAPNKPQ